MGKVASEEFVRLILSSTGEGIYGIDLNGLCTFANPACVRILGFDSVDDLLGQHMHNLVHHTRPDGTPYPEKECRIYQAFRSGKGTHVDDEVMFKKGDVAFPAEYWSFPMEQDGELVGCVLTFVDITDRKKVEADLLESHEFVRLLLDSTGEGIYGVDLQGNCTFANPACAEILGFESVDVLLGKHMHNLVHHTRPNGQPYPVEECRIYKAFVEGKGTNVDDEVMFCADGKAFPAEYWSYPVHKEGELVGCVVTFNDITERNQIEEELRQTEKMAALGKLSAGLAHELNNPAAAAGRAANQLVEGIDALQAAMVGVSAAGVGVEEWQKLDARLRYFRDRAQDPGSLSAVELSDSEDELIDWLEDHDVDKAWETAPALVGAGIGSEDLDALEDIVDASAVPFVVGWLCQALAVNDLARTVVSSSTGISELVGVVKSYSHMDRAPVQDVDIHDGLEDTLKILAHKMRSGVELERDYDRTIPLINTFGSELNQVWTNLIDNAIAAMEGKGTLKVRTYRDDGLAAVEIMDDGPGIPAAIQSKIFDPFFTTKDVGEGTGLGLDVVRRIVTKRCGGSIDLRSRPGETAFTVRVPHGGDEECTTDLNRELDN
ncbi:MAG: PAS domain S-box protein [Gemmatimonadota bacterium]